MSVVLEFLRSLSPRQYIPVEESRVVFSDPRVTLTFSGAYRPGWTGIYLPFLLDSRSEGRRLELFEVLTRCDLIRDIREGPRWVEGDWINVRLARWATFEEERKRNHQVYSDGGRVVLVVDMIGEHLKQNLAPSGTPAT